MGTTPTVRIRSDETEAGYIIINASDFDADQHEEYRESARTAANDDDPDVPEGVELDHVGGGYYQVKVDGQHLQEEDADGPARFRGKAAAIEAYAAFAAAQEDGEEGVDGDGEE